jgi:hypothetical protein
MATGHKIMNWGEFLKDITNKNNFIKFMVIEWQTEANRQSLKGKILYATCMERCVKITADAVEEVVDLTCSHEEADTRLLLHAAHAAQFHYESVIIHSEDTDVRLLCIAFASQIAVPMYQRCKASARTTYIDITKASLIQGESVSRALPGYHAFTGCDSVSFFSGRGKSAGLKLIKYNQKYQDLFVKLGKDWDLCDTMFELLQEFTCLMYAKTTKCVDVNSLRYEMCVSKKGKVESHHLPPCKNTLYKHCERACYQACIWNRCLEANAYIPSPVGKGWYIEKEDGQEILKIDWMSGKPDRKSVV